MNPSIDDAQWASLRSAWQARDELPRVDADTLRHAVALETQRMRRSLFGEIALSIAAVVFAVWCVLARVGPRPRVVAGDTVGVVVVVWAFVLWGRRGLWAPATETSHAYVLLRRRRSRLKLLTAWLALVLVAVQAAVVLATGVGNRDLAIAAVVAWGLWSVWMRRRAIREMQYYDSLLQDPADAGGS